jgi:hypothetical protein
MSDLGTRWIAPQWSCIPIHLDAGDEIYMNPRVFIANPGPVAAKVTVEFRKLDGSIYSAQEQTIPPHQSYNKFFPDQRGDEETMGEGGWVNIFSDQPVAPFGTTMDQLGGTTSARVNMTFFRLDEIHVQPIMPPKK